LKEWGCWIAYVDYYHACQHLKEGLDAAYPNDNAKAQAQFRHYKTILRDERDGVKKVVRALRYYRDKARDDPKIKESLTYFVNNQQRMKYAEAGDPHYPIGSGVVEAACKSLVAHRLKRSGMSWCHAGGQAVLTVRAW